MQPSRLSAWVVSSAAIFLFSTGCTEWNEYVNAHASHVARTVYVQNSRPQNSNSIATSNVSATPAAEAVATPQHELPKHEEEGRIKQLRWLAPNAEATWEKSIQNPERLATELEVRDAFRTATGLADGTQAEGQLEAFGTRYMPNAYAQYQEVRAKAIELQQMVMETFPKGQESDPTGGTMFEKASINLLKAAARTWRRRDELCFFLLFHQAGFFSEDDLANFDSSPIVIQLEAESSDWPDDTPKADPALTAENATFAAKYLPETQAGYQRLCSLFEEGAKQYADLRQTALALGAPRARREFVMLKTRLEELKGVLQRYQNDISSQRLEHAFGETTAESLAALDQANAVKIQKYEREMGLKAYVHRAAMRLFVTLPGGATMEMVWCPQGTFMMGSTDGYSDEEPVHEVTLTKGFWMAKTEVTQAQWKSVMGKNPSNHEGDNLPVECVSWNDCQKFCQKTGLALPTEAEWEYACRAGTTGAYAGKLEDMGWYEGNSGNRTRPVGQKQPNAWGLYDMHGNVWEWCQDWYGGYSAKAASDPTGAGSGADRVLRGGGCRRYASDCRSADRYRGDPGCGGGDDGFRPVARQD